MSTLPQSEQKDTRSVRIREDIWEAARLEAFNTRASIIDVLDGALRVHFKLPATESMAQ